MRTDIHRPSAIQPEDYDFVAFDCMKISDLGDSMIVRMERERLAAHKARTGGTTSTHQHGGNCHICGAHAIYTATFWHRPSNTYVKTGTECADKLDCGDGEMFRRQVKDDLDRVAGKRKAEALLAKAGMEAAWAIYKAAASEHREESIIKDITHRIVQYGSMSDAQAGYLRRLLDQVARRPQIQAERAAEAEAAKPIPVQDKRTTIRGKILTFKTDDFGTKMLVQHADGWKVWGTMPAALTDALRGDEIEFTAALKPSDRDPKFGFFSRPTGAKVLTRTQEVAA